MAQDGGVSVDNPKLEEVKIRLEKKPPGPFEPIPKIDQAREEIIRKDRLANDADEMNIRLKRMICYWVMVLVTCYLIFIAVVVFSVTKVGNISDSVLIAMLTTTTVNILGLPLMIIVSLFPKKTKNTIP